MTPYGAAITIAIEAQGHGERLVRAPQVVAPAQQERRRAHVLRRLHEGHERAHENRNGEPVGPEDRVRDRSEERQRERSENSAGELDLKRADEEPAELPPLLADDVAESELRQRLLHRQVEEHLEETDGRERRDVDAELLQAEDARCDDRAQDPEDDRGVDPRSRRGPTPEDAGGHLLDARSGTHGGPEDGHDTAPDRHPPSSSRLTSLHDE